MTRAEAGSARSRWMVRTEAVWIEWEPAGRTLLRLDGQRRNLQKATGHQVVDILTRRQAAGVDSKVGSDPRPHHNILLTCGHISACLPNWWIQHYSDPYCPKPVHNVGTTSSLWNKISVHRHARSNDRPDAATRRPMFFASNVVP
jgi:hypothetical protein